MVKTAAAADPARELAVLHVCLSRGGLKHHPPVVAVLLCRPAHGVQSVRRGEVWLIAPVRAVGATIGLGRC